MKKSNFYISIIIPLFYLIAIGFNLYSDERSEPKDIIIAVDKSLSMEEKISEVKDFINEAIIDRLIKDDYIMIIIFYGSAELAASKSINDPVIDKSELKRTISQIMANGPFTDIGNVLDRLKDEFSERLDNNRKKECFLITDGINEPTRYSKYFTIDRILKHSLLSDLHDIIVKNGWKVQFLALGNNSKVESIATTIEADYNEVKQDATKEEIIQVIEDPIGSISVIKESIKPIVINQKGYGNLKFNVITDRYLKAPEVIISRLELKSLSFSDNSILANIYSTILPLKGEKELIIPLYMNNKLKAGNYNASMLFAFASAEHFDENSILVTLHVNNIFENYWWLLPLIILGAILLILILAFIIYSLLQGKSINFKVIVKEAPIPEGKNRFKISKSKELYLTESLDVISLLPKKSRKSIGKLTYLPNGIKVYMLNEYRFENPEMIPDNLLGQTIQIRTLSNKIYSISFFSLT